LKRPYELLSAKSRFIQTTHIKLRHSTGLSNHMVMKSSRDNLYNSWT